MSLLDIKDPEELLLPDIHEKHFENAVINVKPSVSKDELAMQEKFTGRAARSYVTIQELYGEPGASRVNQDTQNSSTDTSDAQQNTQNEMDEDEERLMKFVTDTTNKLEQQKKEQKEKKKKLLVAV